MIYNTFLAHTIFILYLLKKLYQTSSDDDFSHRSFRHLYKKKNISKIKVNLIPRSSLLNDFLTDTCGWHCFPTQHLRLQECWGWNLSLNNDFLTKTCREGGVKMVEQDDVEFVSPRKYVKNTSTNETVFTEHLLNISRRLWTPERIRSIPL